MLLNQEIVVLYIKKTQEKNFTKLKEIINLMTRKKKKELKKWEEKYIMLIRLWSMELKLL